MAQFSLPFPGTTPNDAGPYSSAQWARVWRTIQSGILRDDAATLINTGNGTDLPLFVEETGPASTQVQVNIGAALIIGYWYESTAIENLQIDPNTDASGDDRIDLIILRLDITNKQTRLAVLKGTVAPVPVAPALTQTATIWEVQMASVAVANGFATIVDANIDNSGRDYARLWDYRQGGTGLASYSVRQKFMGQADSSLAVELLSGFAIQRAATTGGIAGSSWQTVALDADDATMDPDALISIAANVITFALAGYYVISGHCILNASAAGAFAHFRLRDTTNGVTLAAHTGTPSFTTAQIFVPFHFDQPILIPGDATDVELQIYGQGAGLYTIAPGANPASGEQKYGLLLHGQRWG